MILGRYAIYGFDSMTRLWKWIVVFWVICAGFPYAVPSHFFNHIRTPMYGDSTGYRVTSAVLFAVTLITLIRFLFRMHLPAAVAGITAITAILFVVGHIVYTSHTSTGLVVFAFSLFLGFLAKRAGSLYGEEISATKESSNIHLSQSAEFLVVYLVMMIKLLPNQGLREIAMFLLRIWHYLKPLVDQLSKDISALFHRVTGLIF